MVFLWVNLPALGVHDYGTMEPSTNVVPRRIQLNDAAAIPQQRRQRMSRGSARELIALSREDHIWGKTGDLKNKSKKGKSKSWMVLKQQTWSASSSSSSPSSEHLSCEFHSKIALPPLDLQVRVVAGIDPVPCKATHPSPRLGGSNFPEELWTSLGMVITSMEQKHAWNHLSLVCFVSRARTWLPPLLHLSTRVSHGMWKQVLYQICFEQLGCRDCAWAILWWFTYSGLRGLFLLTWLDSKLNISSYHQLSRNKFQDRTHQVRTWWSTSVGFKVGDPNPGKKTCPAWQSLPVDHHPRWVSGLNSHRGYRKW